jgi:hypothetical protein
MALIPDELIKRLRANGSFNATRRSEGQDELDFMPVVKIFCPWGGATWLLSELDPEDTDIAFGLCDLGLGFPELGSVRISELEELAGPGGLKLERDLYFKATKTLTAYADEAHAHERIIA